MQLTDNRCVPKIQIHIAGRGMIQLHREGQCVGFAKSYRNAERRAEMLELFFARKETLGRAAVGMTLDEEFCSAGGESDAQSEAQFANQEWLVEGMGINLFPIKCFARLAEAECFAGHLRAYNLARPVSGDDGQWTEALIEWWESHPAQAAADCQSFRIRAVPVLEGLH
ncbi:hypothetical protein [Pseudomonas oryzihabitans]|uniref:Uncharacterized protein n=1 Tax=Pseudomonas oryzihabitans TaxID=47885 RepID=A0A178LJD5_9PSED|nr:hypothetical protein [Pseudomonas oryzihabitans]OAN31120.1 hypothetical protein A4V15_14005 [Pseudomonas oryzihabitans]